MVNVHIDARCADDRRRACLFDGHLFVYSRSPAAAALCDHARTMIREAFAPLDPEAVHEALPVERCVAILAELKPRFIHHPRSKALIQRLLAAFGCDLERSYFDVPRLRSGMPKDYLTSGIAYAFHPHRDTWYSAPQCQINWWLPVFDLCPDNAMAFHPRYWSEAIRNDSRDFNIYRWNAESRGNAAAHVRGDQRRQPRPEEPLAPDPDLRLLCEPGGLIMFSGAQLHSSVPNTAGRARYSIDFRTVHLDDAIRRDGAPNLDSACTGTTLRDFLRASDLAPLPAEVVTLYDDGVPADGVAVFSAPPAAEPR